MAKYKLASFFSGAGGLDLGFKNAGFETVFANDIWKGCHDTFEKNHGIVMTKKSIALIEPGDIPEVTGFIGGPPCQSWSALGKKQGISDPRGKLFWTYLDLIAKKKPTFFLAENVAGMLFPRYKGELQRIIDQIEAIGYNVSFKLLNAKDYGVPQERKRVFIVGYNKDVMGDKKFEFPAPIKRMITLKESIGDLPPAIMAGAKDHTLDQVFNNEYTRGKFSAHYMSSNRAKGWNQQAFTVAASAQAISIHPSAPEMIRLGHYNFKFAPGFESSYRRLSVRECARIQTFPDNFIFKYKSVSDGYKMIGNAVPVKLAEILAKKILLDIEGL
jgi:DNA (cytosine-5)-methyltransferase 1